MDRSREISIFNSQFSIPIVGWMVAIAATTVYLLTMEPTVSFWDCGEFIATSYGLEVGHPPGAPLYTLLAHCFTLLAGSPERVAWWSNALSAVAGGLTAMFLFWTICRLLNGEQANNNSTNRHLNNSTLSSLVGTACYVFCDTAWFSAVESEVYSLSMLFSSAIVWAMVRWAQCDDRSYAPRWLMLVSLLLGLSVCVHQLSLLTIPALLVIFFTHRIKENGERTAAGEDARVPSGERRTERSEIAESGHHRQKLPLFTIHYSLFTIFFFLIGLTPYLIIPIRAAADPPINMGDPSTEETFHDYFTRSQYEHAPLLYGRCYNSPVVDFDDNGKPVYAPEMDMLFPRMWKRGTYSDLYYNDWCGRHGKMVEVRGEQYYKPSQLDNLIIFGGYQIGYMYLRYLMWNFSGRYNDRQGFGNLQNGQFITGIPFLDRLYVGVSARMPDSMPSTGHNRYFMLPLLLGIIGFFYSFKIQNSKFKIGPTLLTLFLMSSLALSVYLNHPMYEPRERDYAYILSFYTFAIWIAYGAKAIVSFFDRKISIAKYQLSIFNFLFLFVPILMAFQNWDDHDRSGRYIARDTARNMLESCDENALLFTLGDNDTFPLWYLQEVEKVRTDVQVINISLLGSDSYARSIRKQLANQAGSYLSLSETGGSYRRMMAIINNYGEQRTPYFSHYAERDKRVDFDGHLQLCGMVYRLSDTASADSVDLDRCSRLMAETLQWESLEDVYIDETSHGFLRQYWLDAILAAENLAGTGRDTDARQVLDKTMESIPLNVMCDPELTYQASQAYSHCGDASTATTLAADCRHAVDEQLAYYATMRKSMQQYIPYTIEPLRTLREKL